MILRTSNSYVRLLDAELAAFVDLVVERMTDNPNFTTPIVPLASLAAANTAFKAAITGAAGGDREAIAERNAKRDALIVLVAQLGAYVQAVAAGELSVLLSSGFEPVRPKAPPVPLPKPEILSISNPASGQLALRLKKIDTARAYEVRISHGANGWQNSGVFTQARKIVLSDLIPGTTYTVQVRAIGGSTGASDWSDPVSHMSL